MLIDEKITFSDIEKLAKGLNNKLLKDISLFDIYKGDKIESGKKSYAVSFTFLDTQRTLTDEEVDKIMNHLISQYQKILGAVLR